ncbi:MAG TPA: zinc dependent phospholipase C family protein [Clostridia bacterium]|nr:zinc dependent phospholipase C family protein [Clostridia bacterium]
MRALVQAGIDLPERLLPACRMGAQGPDLLFGYRLITLEHGISYSPFGRMMHTERTGDFLCAFAEQAAGDEAVRAFVLGFIAHYATDTALHPYVYGNRIPHLALEKRMDRALYRKMGGHGIPRYNEFMEQTHEQWEGIAKAWGRAAQDVYPGSGLDASVLLQAFQDMERLTPLMQSRLKILYGIAWGGERLFKKPGFLTGHIITIGAEKEDVLNLSRRPWYSPYEPARCRNESVLDLMDRSVDSASRWMTLVQACWQGEVSYAALRESLGQLSYLTGLPVDGARG